ncbi:MAG: hypothetical protein IT384_14415 [Deltaproteobacteria bacterium]|nr:hypothetical protein [Deltaproteobacteria bacterium]
MSPRSPAVAGPSRESVALLAALAALAAALGCQPREPRATVLQPPGSQTGLRVVEIGDRLTAEVFEARSEATLWVAELPDAGTGRLTVFFFPFSLQELDLTVGPVELVGAGPGTRRIPPSIEIHEAQLNRDGPGAFSAGAEIDAARSRWQLPPLNGRACVARGGCADPATDFATCTEPCPEPGPTAPPKPPTPVLAPDLVGAGCLPGWQPSSITTGIATLELCRAVAETVVDCGAGRALFLGGCARVGSDCPSGDYNALTPAGAVHVHPVGGDDRSGDGSSARPLATVLAAMALAPDDGIISLARGRYLPVVVPSRGVTLLGACPEETVLLGGLAPGPDDGGRLRDLSVRSSTFAVFLDNGAWLDLERVRLDAPAGVAIELRTRARLSARTIEVRARGEYTLVAGADTETALTDATLAAGSAAGVDILGPRAQATLTRVRIAPEPQGSVPASASFIAEGSSTATLIETLIEGGTNSAMAVLDGAVVTSTHGVLLNAPRPSILVDHGGRLELSRGRVTGAAIVRGTGSRLNARDALFQQRGVTVEAHSTAELSRTTVVGAEQGITASGLDALIRASDLQILDCTKPAATTDPAHGVQAKSSASVEIDRLRVSRCFNAGVEVREGASAVIHDLSISRIEAHERTLGVFVHYGSRATLARVRIDGTAGAIRVDDTDTVVVVEDATILGANKALTVLDQARLIVRRAELEPRTAGLDASAAGHATLTDVRIGAPRGEPRTAATGLEVGSEAVVSAQRFVLHGLATGAAIKSAEIDLRDGSIEDNGVGVSIRPPGYVTSRLVSGVVFRSNDADFEE